MKEHGRRNMIAGFVCSVLTAASPRQVAAQSAKATSAVEPNHVTIIGADYAFSQLPTTLAGGPTLFSFENRGLKRHELSVALLRPDVTMDELLRGGEQISVSARAVSDSIIGLLIARPGERSGGQLYANLIAGRTYVVICTLKDTPDARRHAELGMIGSFKVR
jgi:hypothetical protein